MKLRHNESSKRQLIHALHFSDVADLHTYTGIGMPYSRYYKVLAYSCFFYNISSEKCDVQCKAIAERLIASCVYNEITGCAVAQHCFKSDQPVQ